MWAIVEAKDASGLYRSDDFGATWQRLNDSIDLLARPWYYMHIYADPQDAETVYVLNLGTVSYTHLDVYKRQIL